MPKNNKSIRKTNRIFAKPILNSLTATTTTAVSFSKGKAAAEVTINKSAFPIGATGNGLFTANGSNIEGSAFNTSGNFSFAARTTNANWGSNTTIYVKEGSMNGDGQEFELAVKPNFTANLFNGEVLAIGGGGGGEITGTSNRPGGAGGAGGYREFSQIAFAPDIAITITIGAGGATQSNGSNSILREIIAAGGGRGWDNLSITAAAVASPFGGSAGGAGAQNGVGTSQAPLYRELENYGDIELYTTSGSNGGACFVTSGSGGGGGANAAGADGAAGVGGNGGAGTASSITGSSVTRAGGGGGGGSTTGGTGGAGGGGNGGQNTVSATAGTVNTGGGGGGAARDGSSPAAGGSGIVIIKIPDTHNASFSAGVTSSLSTSVAGFNIYSVTATSTTSETVTFSVI